MRGGRAHRGEGALPGARFLQSRAHRVKHVRARVAVGNGIDIQRVDLVDVRLEASGRGLERTQHRRSVELR